MKTNTVSYLLTTFTPLHIGSGQRYSAIEYIYDPAQKVIKKYSIDKILETAEKLGYLKNLGNFFKREQVKSLEEICQKDPYFSEILKKTEPDYVIPAQNLVGSPFIEEFIKTQGKIYIPGSELKGSLRRAILVWVLNQDQKLLECVIKKLKEIITHENFNKKHFSQFTEVLEEEVFRDFQEGKKILNFNQIREKASAQLDILKFVCISDSEFEKVSENNLRVEEIEVRYINGTVKRDVSLFSEVIPLKNKFVFSISVKKIPKINDRFKAHPEIKKLIATQDPEEIKKAWIEGERITIKIDKHIIPPIAEKEMPSFSKKLINYLKTETEKVNLIRLGKHEGYLFTTIMGLIKIKDEKLFEKVFKLSVPRSSFPLNKTRKLVKSNKLPLGFCSIKKLA